MSARSLDWRTEGLRAVLFGYGIGHLVTATLFIGWPAYFLVAEGAGPPWPLSIFQFGVWPPLHQGFMNVLATYDIAVAVGLFIAAWAPKRNRGLLVFFMVLWTLHAGAHASHIVWGSSPSNYWWTVVELGAGVVLVGALFPRRA